MIIIIVDLFITVGILSCHMHESPMDRAMIVLLLVASCSGTY